MRICFSNWEFNISLRYEREKKTTQHIKCKKKVRKEITSKQIQKNNLVVRNVIQRQSRYFTFSPHRPVYKIETYQEWFRKIILWKNIQKDTKMIAL